MGIDYYSTLMIAIPLKELVKEQNAYEIVTKYNQNTGEPYEFKSQYIELTSNYPEIVQITKNEEIDHYDEIKKLLKLEIDLNHQFIGTVVSQIDMRDEDSNIVDEKNLTKIIQDVKQKLEKINCKIEPKLYHFIVVC